MIPYDIDPSLHSGEPKAERLDDGFSPRSHHDEEVDGDIGQTAEPGDPHMELGLPVKSSI